MRRALGVAVEPVTNGEGYVAKVVVDGGSWGVIVQPTWELLVEALAEHLRGLGAMSDELFEGCARRGGVCDCGERPCAIDARANRPGFGNFPVCERHWRKLQGDREPTRIVDPPERRCCFCGKANRDGIGMRLDRRAVSYPETEL